MLNQKELIVIKIGTAVLSKKDNYLDLDFMKDVARQCELLMEKYRVLIVSSGAIGCGMKQIGFKTRPDSIEQVQACAAVGQSDLMFMWKQAFGKRKISQFLLSYDCFVNQQKYHNLVNCIDAVLSFDAIPIANENDTIATDELGGNFGDNDKLSVLLAKGMKAKKIIMLCDVDGLYDKNPNMFPNAEVIPEVMKITQKTLDLAFGKSTRGLGGMHSKLKAMELVLKDGIDGYITNGRKKDSILNVFSSEFDGTKFCQYI